MYYTKPLWEFYEIGSKENHYECDKIRPEWALKENILVLNGLVLAV